MSFKIAHEYFIVELNSHQLPSEAIQWLKENCGSGPDATWFYKPPNLYFENSKHHLMFALKWS